MKKIKSIKKYEEGGSSDCTKWPPTNGCKKTYKSKGKSRETKGGGLMGILGGAAAGLAGYKLYKKLKEEKNGGTVKKTRSRKK